MKQNVIWKVFLLDLQYIISYLCVKTSSANWHNYWFIKSLTITISYQKKSHSQECNPRPQYITHTNTNKHTNTTLKHTSTPTHTHTQVHRDRQMKSQAIRK